MNPDSQSSTKPTESKLHAGIQINGHYHGVTFGVSRDQVTLACNYVAQWALDPQLPEFLISHAVLLITIIQNRARRFHEKANVNNHTNA